MSIIGITALTEDEQEEFLLLHSLENTAESEFYTANEWWRLGEFHSKMNQPTTAKTYFLKAIKCHLFTLSQNHHVIDSWSLLAKCFKEGIGVSADPLNEKICLDNIEAIKRGNLQLNTLPLEIFNQYFNDVLHKASQVLSYFNLQSRRDALKEFTEKEDEANVALNKSVVPLPLRSSI